MVGNFSNIYGGSAVRPSYPSYAALTIAVNTTLVWPTESLEGVPYVAAELDVTATVGSLSLAMPSALAGATGVATMVSNVGSINLNLTDSAGNLIVTLAPSVSWLISLTNNTTAAGTWRALQMASTTTTASASALADNITTQANAGKLQVIEGFNSYTANTNIIAANRGALNVLGTGASGNTTFTLDTVVNLTAGWFAEFSNRHSTALLLIAASGGATFNGSAGPITLNPGTSIRIVCDGTGFQTGGAELLTQYAVLLGGGATGTPIAVVGLGTTGQVLTSTGAGSAPAFSSVSSGFATVVQQAFVGTGTYTPTPGMKFCIVQMVGGGAGGFTTAAGIGGGGGGAGEYAESVFSAATIGGTQAVTIGAGGAASANGNTTSLGTLMTALGGAASTNSIVGIGGLGGSGGTGPTNSHVPGGDGGPSCNYGSSAYWGGHGGASFYGDGGKGGAGNLDAGSAGRAYGSGGGGGGLVSGTYSGGGAGAPGFMLITEFL
jgi:hypothetical protein